VRAPLFVIRLALRCGTECIAGASALGQHAQRPIALSLSPLNVRACLEGSSFRYHLPPSGATTHFWGRPQISWSTGCSSLRRCPLELSTHLTTSAGAKTELLRPCAHRTCPRLRHTHGSVSPGATTESPAVRDSATARPRRSSTGANLGSCVRRARSHVCRNAQFIPLSIIGTLYIAVFGKWLLPDAGGA
jgi:hypothetical protein